MHFEDVGEIIDVVFLDNLGTAVATLQYRPEPNPSVNKALHRKSGATNYSRLRSINLKIKSLL